MSWYVEGIKVVRSSLKENTRNAIKIKGLVSRLFVVQNAK